MVAPRKQPFQTIIPGFATDLTGAPVMAFGVMGAPMQAQTHLQMALRVLGHGQNPQAAADAPRWRVTGGYGVAVEAGFDSAHEQGLTALGHSIRRESPNGVFGFGGAQMTRHARHARRDRVMASRVSWASSAVTLPIP